jgi:hypothetical protein
MAYGACDDPKAGCASHISYLIDEQGRSPGCTGR